MIVILVNGSPNEKGCTFTALEEIAATLNSEGIDTKFFQLGAEPLPGCKGCRECAKIKKCIYDDKVNEFLDLAHSCNADGFVFGSPVHFASAGGSITSFMDRVFYCDMCAGKDTFYLKPAAAIVSARRAGTTASLDQLNKYFAISQMPIISSRYWNMVHGSKPEDVKQDLEGLQIMRVLGKNMAWFLKCKKAGILSGIDYPQKEERIATNFIR